MLLAHHELNGTGPPLLFLHANSMPGMVYLPMAQQVLASQFRCIAMDAPGHGSSPAWDLDGQPLAVDALVQAVYDTICHLEIQGCYVFGNSLGGLLALRIEAAHPGTFTAMYLYEPAGVSAASAQEIAEWAEAKGVHANGPLGHMLAKMALNNPSSWPSREAAAADLRNSFRFKVFHPDAFDAFVQSGLRPVKQSGAAVPGKDANVDEPVELCCSNKMEAAVFYCFEPLPQFDQSKVRCPVLCASSTVSLGDHGLLAHAASVIARDLPCGTHHSFEGLTHFGPMQQPEVVAKHVLAFFQSCKAEA